MVRPCFHLVECLAALLILLIGTSGMLALSAKTAKLWALHGERRIANQLASRLLTLSQPQEENARFNYQGVPDPKGIFHSHISAKQENALTRWVATVAYLDSTGVKRVVQRRRLEVASP